MSSIRAMLTAALALVRDDVGHVGTLALANALVTGVPDASARARPAGSTPSRPPGGKRALSSSPESHRHGIRRAYDVTCARWARWADVRGTTSW